MARQVAGDRAQQVGLAQPRRPVEEERVVGLARQLGHRERGGVGEAAAGADHEAVEGVRRVDRAAARPPSGAPRALARAERLGRGLDQDDPLKPAPRAAAPPRLVDGSAARPSRGPAPGAVRVQRLGPGADRAQGLEPEVERGGGERGPELRADALQIAAGVVLRRGPGAAPRRPTIGAGLGRGPRGTPQIAAKPRRRRDGPGPPRRVSILADARAALPPAPRRAPRS